MNLGEYISQLDAPPASSGIPRATAAELGGDAAARGMGELAKAAMEYDQVFREQADGIQRAQELSAVGSSTRKQVKSMEASLAQDPDWQTYDKRWADGFSKIKESALNGIADPLVKKAAVTHLGSIEEDGVNRAATHSRKMAVDSFESFRLSSRKSALDTVSTASSQQEEDSAIADHIGVIAAQEQGGWLDADKATKEKQTFVQEVLVSRAKRDILADPASYYQKKRQGAYTGVDLGKMDLLDQAAIRQMDYNDRVIERQQKKITDKNDAIFMAAVENGTITDAEADDAFLGPTRDPDFTSLISPGAYKEGKLKLAVRRREGGPQNSGIMNAYKIELAINPHRYSDKEITRLGDRGLNPKDVLDILEYKRARIDDLQKMPPGAITGLELIRLAVPRGFLNTMNDKVRAKLIENEQEYISRVRKNPEKWESIAGEISNRWKAVKNPGQTPEEIAELKNLLRGGTEK